MFYSIAFAGGSADETPLKVCWQLAHGRKLKKNHLLQFSIPNAAELISKPTIALSLRTQAYLATGLVIILKLKTGFLLNDVQAIRNKLEQWDAQHKAETAAKRSNNKKKKSRKTANDTLFRPQSKAGITLDEEDVPHLLEALQANNGQRESMMLQLAESDEFTLLGSFKFSSDARNASLNAADVDAELEDMLRVTLPNDDPSMYMDDIDAMRYGADAEGDNDGLGARLIRRRRERALSEAGDPSGSFSDPSGSGMSHGRTYGYSSMNLDDDLAPLEGDMDLPMLALPRPSKVPMPDDNPPQPQNSSPQQSLSLCNPASGSHSQASPDPLNAAPEVSDGHMHGMFNSDDFEITGADTHGMHGTPRNFMADPESTQNTGNSSGRHDIDLELDSQNVPSPGSQRVHGEDSRFDGDPLKPQRRPRGCANGGGRRAPPGKLPLARKLRRDSELNMMCPDEYRAMVTQPSSFVPLPPIHCITIAYDAMPDILDEDSFEAALRWRRMPLFEYLPTSTAAFILARSCVDEPDAPTTTERGTGNKTAAPASQKKHLKRAVNNADEPDNAPVDPDEEIYGMHEDDGFMPPNDDFQNIQHIPEDSEMSLGASSPMNEDEEDGAGGHARKRMRVGGVVANNEDITMSADENGGLGVFGGRWSDRYTSDSGGQRGSGSTGGRSSKGEPLSKLDSNLLARAVSGGSGFAAAAARRHALRVKQRAASDASGSALEDETPDMEKLRAAMNGSGSLAGGTFSSLQFGRRGRRDMSASDGTAASKDSYDSRGAGPGFASPPMLDMDDMLPTLHEADGEHDTGMHGDHAHKPHTTTKRARHQDSDPEHPFSAGPPPDDAPPVMDPPENWGSEELNVQSPPDLPEDGSVPLLETQARLTQTQLLEEHITQATADVYDALNQLRSEQVDGSVRGVTALSMHACVEGLNRAEAARVFYQLLVLQTHSMVQLNQQKPYADVSIELLAA